MILSFFSEKLKRSVYNGIEIGKRYDINPICNDSEYSYIIVNEIYRKDENSDVKCKYTICDIGKKQIYYHGYLETVNYYKEDKFDCLFTELQSKIKII